MKRFDLINKAYSSGLMNAEEIAEVFSYPKFEVIETLLRQGHCQCCIDRKFLVHPNARRIIELMENKEQRLRETFDDNKKDKPLKKKPPKAEKPLKEKYPLWNEVTSETMGDLEQQANEMMKDYKLPFFQDEE